MSGGYEFMLYGFIVAEQLVIALYFARFWRATRDPFFLFFAAGFVVMTLHRVLLGFAKVNGVELEQQTWIFAIRAASYLLILAGIVQKNIRARR